MVRLKSSRGSRCHEIVDVVEGECCEGVRRGEEPPDSPGDKANAN